MTMINDLNLTEELRIHGFRRIDDNANSRRCTFRNDVARVNLNATIVSDTEIAYEVVQATEDGPAILDEGVWYTGNGATLREFAEHVADVSDL